MAKRTIPAQCKSAAVLYQRIDAIIKLIPKDFPRREDVITALRDRQESLSFTAPHAMTERWKEVEKILMSKLPDPASATWATQIAEIFKKEFSG